jgi:2,3,4,5-tetrahydropyridine-2-carboxylate N-succinyltransferase
MSDIAQLRDIVESAFERRDSIGASTGGDMREAVEAALDLLDSGVARVAEKRDGAWTVNQWLKKAVLLSFRLNDMGAIPAVPAARRGGTRSRRSSPG